MLSFFTRGKLTAKSSKHFARIDSYNRKVSGNAMSKSVNHKRRAMGIHRAFGGGYVH